MRIGVLRCAAALLAAGCLLTSTGGLLAQQGAEPYFQQAPSSPLANPAGYGGGVSPSEMDWLRQRLDRQEAELQELRRQQSATRFASSANESLSAADAATASAADSIDPNVKIKKVDTITKPVVKLDGRILWDAGWFDQSLSNMQTPGIGDIQDGVDFREVRLGASGVAYENISFKLEMDFAAAGRPSFNDEVWINVGELPILRNIKVGRFKEPFSLEQLTSTRFLTFMERSLADAFVPGKTVGVMEWGYTELLDATWAVGVFRTKTDEFGDGVADDGDHSLTARLTFLPYYDEPSDGRYLFHIGGDIRYSRTLNNTVAFASRPEIKIQADTAKNGDDGGAGKVPNFVNTGNINAFDYEVFDIEAAWVNGPLSIQSEFILTPVNQIAGPDLFFPGAYVYVSYFLTGESRPYNRQQGKFERVVPYENFFRARTCDGTCCGKGAWEVAFRWSYIDLDDQNIHGGTETDFTTGVNWYLNPNTRMMFNWIHANLDKSNIESFADLFGVRFQIDF